MKKHVVKMTTTTARKYYTKPTIQLRWFILLFLVIVTVEECRGKAKDPIKVKSPPLQNMSCEVTCTFPDDEFATVIVCKPRGTGSKNQKKPIYCIAASDTANVGVSSNDQDDRRRKKRAAEEPICHGNCARKTISEELVFRCLFASQEDGLYKFKCGDSGIEKKIRDMADEMEGHALSKLRNGLSGLAG